MKKTKMIKPVLSTVLTIAAVTAAFMGVTQTIVSAEYNTVDKTTISYSSIAYNNNQTHNVPEGYVKANYTVIDSIYSENTAPTNIDISRDEAAEIGVQALYEVFQLDLEGKTILMSYSPAAFGMRSQWQGSYWPNGMTNSVPAHSFTVDAVTGELLTVMYHRLPDPLSNKDFNMELHENPKAYEDLAKKYAEEYNIISGKIVKAEYDRQEAVGEAVINVYVWGENSERVYISIALYDDALMGAAYNAGVNEMYAALQWYEEEVRKEQ